MKQGTNIAALLLISVLLMTVPSCSLFKGNHKTEAETSLGARSAFDSHFIDGCTLFNNGSYSACIKSFNRCVNIDPNEASVYYQLSRAYLNTGDANKSMLNAMKACELAPQNVFYVLWYSDCLKNAGMKSEAIKILEKSFETHPKDLPLLKALDDLYAAETDMLQKRILAWQKYRLETGYKLNTALKLIDLYKLKKDYVSAHKVYDEIKQSSPLKYQYYIDDGNLYLDQKDETNAMINFKKALQIKPDNFNLNISLFKLYVKKGDKAQAIQFLKQAYSDRLTGVDIKLNTCTELNHSFSKDTAYRDYLIVSANEMLIQYPNNDKAVYTVARFYELVSMWDKSLESYKKVYELNPNMFEAWTAALRICDLSKNYEKKAKIAENALEYYPNIASLYHQASDAYIKLKQYAKAIEMSRTGINYALDKDVKYNLIIDQGIANFMLSKYTEAKIALTEAKALSETKEVYEYLGDTEYKLGNAPEAMNNWKKAKELGLNSEKLDQKIKTGIYVE